MEQLYNTMLTSVQVPQERPVTKKDNADGDGFQKLMEQKQASDSPASAAKQERPEAARKDAQQPQKQETKDSEPVQGAPKSGRELEEQMALAAMAMLQNPVVPVEQVLTPEAPVETVAVEIVPVTEEVVSLVEDAVLTPEEQTFQPEAEQALDIPVEGESSQAVEQTLVEELPQTVKVPEAAQEAEGQTVEVKVETGEARPDEAEPAEESTEETSELQGAEAQAPVFEKVEAVPVKVGEAPKAEKAQQPMEDQIVPKLTEALNNGETRVELQLTPENLGKVKVEMTWKEDGSLVVQIHAENRETQNLLNKNASGLEALLGREIQQEVRVEVPRQEESQRQDLYDQQQGHHKQQQEQREHRRNQPEDSENFLQQLRLGLIPMEEQ